jgi:hypothetical protein
MTSEVLAGTICPAMIEDSITVYNGAINSGGAAPGAENGMMRAAVGSLVNRPSHTATGLNYCHCGPTGA